MFIWHLKQHHFEKGPNCEAVVVANDEFGARVHAAGGMGVLARREMSPWMDKTQTTCRFLGETDTEPVGKVFVGIPI